MKIALKAALFAGIALIAAPQIALAAAPVAAATAPVGPILAGLAVVNLDAVRANSNAFKTAQAQRPVTYKAQFDAAEARRAQIEAQMLPLITKFNADRALPAPNAALLQQQGQTIQSIQESGQQELQRMLQPVALSEAYVDEQITDKLSAAVRTAMNKQHITILLTPENIVSADNAYNLNQAVLNELNLLIPSAALVPPAGWVPRQVREQQAAAAAQQGGAPAPAAPAAPVTRPATR
jgi:Skp family chaperone for outer membrane proteins